MQASSQHTCHVPPHCAKLAEGTCATAMSTAMPTLPQVPAQPGLSGKLASGHRAGGHSWDGDRFVPRGSSRPRSSQMLHCWQGCPRTSSASPAPSRTPPASGMRRKRRQRAGHATSTTGTAGRRWWGHSPALPLPAQGAAGLGCCSSPCHPGGSQLQGEMVESPQELHSSHHTPCVRARTVAVPQSHGVGALQWMGTQGRSW